MKCCEEVSYSLDRPGHKLRLITRWYAKRGLIKLNNIYEHRENRERWMKILTNSRFAQSPCVRLCKASLCNCEATPNWDPPALEKQRTTSTVNSVFFVLAVAWKRKTSITGLNNLLNHFLGHWEFISKISGNGYSWILSSQCTES